MLLLLAAAGMLRPEAWVLAGLYWLWLVPRATDITLWHNVAISIVMAAVVIRSRASAPRPL